MNSKLTWQGLWWFPDATDNQLSGTLTFDPKGTCELQLMGSFEGLPAGVKRKKIDIINGVTTEGKQVTLYECSYGGGRYALPGIPLNIYRVKFIILGVWFTKKKDVLFNVLRVGYSNLESWLAVRPFQIDRNYIEKTIDLKGAVPVHEAIKISNDLEIKFDGEIKESGHSVATSILYYEASIELKLTKPQTPEVFLTNYLNHIQNFISFGVGATVYPLRVTCLSNKVTEFVGEHKRIASLEILFINQTGELNLFIYHPGQMFFSLADIRREIPVCLKNWFEKSEVMESVYDLYFAVMHNASIYPEHEFLNLAQAIESYHRRVLKERPKKDYDKISFRLKEIIKHENNEELTKILGQTIWHLKEYSLQERLEILFRKYHNLLKGNYEDNFIKILKDTRNYYTHFDPKMKSKALSRKELPLFSKKLKYLLDIVLLDELGLSEDKIKTILKNNIYRYPFMKKKEDVNNVL